MKDKNKNAIEIYDDIAEDYARKFDPIESDDDLIFPNKFLFHLEPESSIVDIGCGTGFSAGYFRKKGMKVEGSDLSTSMITIAKRNYPEIKFSVADMREYSPVESVDAVWAGYCLFHFEQVHFEATLQKIRTYLRPGGILGIVMQEGSGEIEQKEPFAPEKRIYIHLYTEKELVEILTQNGFEVIDRGIKKSADYEFSYSKILLIARKK